MRRGWILVAALLAFSAISLASAQSPPASGAKRVGSEACKDCHENQSKAFGSGPHGRAEHDASRLGAGMDCESCHGPGSLHVEADGDKENPGFDTMVRFGKLPAAEANAACLTCHSGGEQFYWKHSSHERKGVSCVQCHSMHSSKDPGHAKLLGSESVTQQCLSCHKSKHLTMSKSAHMPVKEGSMDCADCHNPHGTSTKHQVRAATVNELCTTCHADKRGPVLWEHAPVRENCLTCHEAHGANNDKVLASKRPFLCQRCHVANRHPSTLYDGPDLASNRLFNRSCTNCHSQVHGSNHPSGRYLMR